MSKSIEDFKNMITENDDVVFYTIDDNAHLFDKFKPKPYNQFKSDYVTQNKKVKGCPGLNNLFELNHIFVLQHAFDLIMVFDFHKNVIDRIITPNSHINNFITYHSVENSNVKVLSHKEIYFPEIIKIHSPWFVKLPKDYILIQRPLDYVVKHDVLDITPGILNCLSHSIIVPALVKKRGKRFTELRFTQGEPFCLLEIINTKNKINVKYSENDQVLYNKSKITRESHGYKFGSRPSFNWLTQTMLE